MLHGKMMERMRQMNAIEIKGLTKQYKDFRLGSFDLTLPAGSIMGLVGENGAGKSTTIKLITHAIAADAGTISVLGVEKGRLIFMLLICGGTFGGMYFKDKLITLSDQIDSMTMPILFIAVFTVIIVCASILISIQLYKSRQK